MAIPREQTVRPTPSWKISLALLACIMAATTTLHMLLDGLGWWFISLLACLVVLGLAALTRVWISHRLVPPLVALFGLSVLLMQQFAAESTFWGLFPTFDTWNRFGELIALAQVSIHEQSVPAEVVPGIMFLVCGGVGLTALLSDVMAIALGARALVAIPLLVVLWIPVMTAERDYDLLWMVLTAVSFLYLLRAGESVPHRRLSLVIGAGSVALALVAQVVLPSADPVVAGNAGTSISTGASPVVNLGNNLRRDVERRALTYTTESGRSQYLKLVSLHEFDGEKWYEGDVDLDPENSPQRFPDAPGLSGSVDRTSESTWIKVAGLDSFWLPLPYPTESVTGLGAGWAWDASSLSLRNSFAVARDEEYRAVSLVLDPTSEQLLAAGSVVPDDLAEFATITGDVPPIIAETAAAVVGDAASNYEKAVALQQFLRFGDFVYSEDAPVDEGYDGTGLDVIGTFLAEKSGYCVHFASAMALMARTLGIPSRVAVGFLPGSKLDEQDQGRVVYEATSHDLHAWPELYFDDIGWLPFEPTTGRGTLPDYANAANEGVPIPPGVGGVTPTTAPTDAAAGERPGEDLGPDVAGGSTGDTGSDDAWWFAVLAIALLILIAAPAFIRWTERRGRIRVIRRGFAPAIVGWREILQSAEDAGTLVPPTATPREAGRMLVAAMRGEPDDGATAAERVYDEPDDASNRRDGAEAVNRIVAIVEKEGFAQPGGGTGVSADDVTLVVSRLLSAVDWWSRVRAIALPASLWRRAKGAIRQVDAT